MHRRWPPRPLHPKYAVDVPNIRYDIHAQPVCVFFLQSAGVLPVLTRKYATAKPGAYNSSIPEGYVLMNRLSTVCARQRIFNLVPQLFYSRI